MCRVQLNGMSEFARAQRGAHCLGGCATWALSSILPLKLPGLRPKLQAEAAAFRMNDGRAIEILLVEDNPGDARLAWEAIREARVCNNLRWVADGVEALAY